MVPNRRLRRLHRARTAAVTVIGLGLDFPHAVQAARILRYRTDPKTGTVSRQTVYAITVRRSETHRWCSRRVWRAVTASWNPVR